METKTFSNPGTWVVKRMLLSVAIAAMILGFIFFVSGCSGGCVTAVNCDAVYSAGIVPGNGTITVTSNVYPTYKTNLFKIGPYGLEGAVMGLRSGGFAVFTSDFTPAYQDITIVAVTYNPDNPDVALGTAWRTFSFSSYGSYGYGYTWQLETGNFRISSPPLGFGDQNGSSRLSTPIGPLTREAASLINLRK